MGKKLPRPAVLQRFGRLRVIIPEGRRKGRRAALCICDCEKVVAAEIRALYSGATKSCGCHSRQLLIERLTTHGLSLVPEYNIYNNIIQRCTNHRNTAWHHYGGRGIKVCQRWLDSFEAFYEDMGPRTSAKHSIERLDNDGHYCPENCVWATKRVQAFNRRSSRLITYQGRTQCLAAWAVEIGIKQVTLGGRIRSGWTVERALTQPVSTKQSTSYITER
jgi:hypothetical protein